MCRITGCQRTVVSLGYCLRHLTEARRAGDPSAFSQTWDRCSQGHPMTIENTFWVESLGGNRRGIEPYKARRCRACERDHTRQTNARRRAG